MDLYKGELVFATKISVSQQFPPRVLSSAGGREPQFFADIESRRLSLTPPWHIVSDLVPVSWLFLIGYGGSRIDASASGHDRR